MDFFKIITSNAGFFHFIVSLIAMIAGMYVLVTQKGTKRHKQVGYIYFVAMVLVNGSAFSIYSLYGKFGLFHWFAVFSSVTLLIGMLPLWVTRFKNAIQIHIRTMYWSVIGLYCAFVSEIFTRLPKVVITPDGEIVRIFYMMVLVGTGLTMAIGLIFFIKFKPKWVKQFQRR
jgi:uncharacterized membrane protein